MPISFSTKRDPNAGLLPAGIYRFYVEAAVEKQASDKPYPYAELRLRPIVKGQKWNSSVWDRLSASPDATFRIDSFMDSVNAPNEPGTAGINWFPGKSGWARFKIETGDDGVDRPKVMAYLTEAQAEKQLAKLAQTAGTNEDAMEISTQRRSRAVEEADEAPVRPRKVKKQAAAVAELDPDDEDVAF